MVGGTIKVRLAFRNPLLTVGVRTLLAGTSGIEIVGDDLRAVGRARSDAVVITGTVGGGDDPGQLLRLLTDWEVATLSRGVLVTGRDQVELLVGAVRIGIRCLVTHDCSAADLVRAIRAAHAGSALVAPALVRPLLDSLVAAGDEDGSSPAVARMTPREREVYLALRRGMSNRDIAQVLTVSVRTVKFHVSNILDKLQVENRGQVIALGARSARAHNPVPTTSAKSGPTDSFVTAGQG